MTLDWWDGRRLSVIMKDYDHISYTYKADGLRNSKYVTGVTTDYYWLNGTLQAQKTGSEYIVFLHDENGVAYGFLLKNGATEEYYYYVFNVQGDVIGILDNSGTQVVEYTYNPWGEILSITGTMADTIGQKNPLRYRGYYYDNETGFYYLRSRYYDPVVCRFINADGHVSTGQGVLGTNMFAYCGNNPVNRSDPSGMFWKEIGSFFSNAWNKIKTFTTKIFGEETSVTATIEKDVDNILPEPLPITVKTGAYDSSTLMKIGNSEDPISSYSNFEIGNTSMYTDVSYNTGIKFNIFGLSLESSISNNSVGISGLWTRENNIKSFGASFDLSRQKVSFKYKSGIVWDNHEVGTYTVVDINAIFFLAFAFAPAGGTAPAPAPSY